MAEFLLSLLLFVFGLGSADHPALNPETITSRIAEFVAEVSAPQGDPENSHQNGPEVSQNTPQNDINPQNHIEHAVQPDTSKVAAYNTESEKYVGLVAAVAVEKAPPLEDCADHPDECDPEAGSQADPPVPTPTPPVPTPTPPIPLPTPIILPIINPCPPFPQLPDNPKIMAPQIICLD